jgi:hypothetical protein
VKNFTVADESGQFSAIDDMAWRGDFPAIILRSVMWRGGPNPQFAETVVPLAEAKALGEWLIAWAKEQGPECCICKLQVPQAEAKSLGSEFAHQKCIDARLQMRGIKP